MQLQTLLTLLDRLAPAKFAEPWDNVGLLIGDPAQHIIRVVLAIDYTPAVAAEAQAAGANLVIAYHPPIFSPIKRLTAPDPLFDAVRRNVAIYSPHTALDVAEGGTNDLLADLLGLQNRTPLRYLTPAAQYVKFVTFAPEKDVDRVAEALFDAGAGHIGRYSHCSFRSPGSGTFKGDETTNPTVGQPGQLERAPEIRIETICPLSKLSQVTAALRKSHPYEEPAFDVMQMAAAPVTLGQGRIGDCPAIDRPALFDKIRQALGLSHLLIAGPVQGSVTRAACLAGAGRENLKDAIAQGAQLYLTGELPHHDALAAARAGVTVVATLHSNSERASLRRLVDKLAPQCPDVIFTVSSADVDPFTVH